MADRFLQRSSGACMAARIAKLRCPRCGRGRIFRSFFIRADCCDQCDWKYEREDGFWVGGSEVHMFASYGASVVIFIPLLIVLGPTPAVQLTAIMGHIACSLLLFRYSRSFFIGFDYFLDPAPPDSGEDDGGNEPVPAEPAPRAPSRSGSVMRRRPAQAASPVLVGAASPIGSCAESASEVG